MLDSDDPLGFQAEPSRIGAVHEHISGVGVYLAQSISRNTKLSIAEPRRAAYSRLWIDFSMHPLAERGGCMFKSDSD